MTLQPVLVRHWEQTQAKRTQMPADENFLGLFTTGIS
jgi:hypothetical protein